MRLFLVFLLLALPSCNVFPTDFEKVQAAFPHLQTNCKISTWSGKALVNLPFAFCIFLSDGSFIASDTIKITRFDSLRRELWSAHFHNHHQLALSNDGKTIFAISSDFLPVKQKLVRFDSIHFLDLQGKSKGKFSVAGHQKELFPDPLHLKMDPVGWLKDSMFKDCRWEASHINSLHEIPVNVLEKKIPAFQAGNYLLSDYGPEKQMFILSKDFKTILWKTKSQPEVHDAQVLPSGKILFFRNQDSKIPKTQWQSSIEIVDPENETGEWIYRETPPFHSLYQGTVQILLNHFFLYTEESHGGHARLVNEAGETLWNQTNPEYDVLRNQPAPSVRVLAVDLTLFLKNFRD